MTEADGTIYNGDFVDNKKSGEGFILYANGDRYEGHFVCDLYHGEGTIFYNDGKEEKGSWKNGVLSK